MRLKNLIVVMALLVPHLALASSLQDSCGEIDSLRPLWNKAIDASVQRLPVSRLKASILTEQVESLNAIGALCDNPESLSSDSVVTRLGQLFEKVVILNNYIMRTSEFSRNSFTQQEVQQARALEGNIRARTFEAANQALQGR